jgi:hypothetical protein
MPLKYDPAQEAYPGYILKMPNDCTPGLKYYRVFKLMRYSNNGQGTDPDVGVSAIWYSALEILCIRPTVYETKALFEASLPKISLTYGSVVASPTATAKPGDQSNVITVDNTDNSLGHTTSPLATSLWFDKTTGATKAVLGAFTNKRNGDVVSFCISDTAATAMAFLEYSRTSWRHTATSGAGMLGITDATSLEVHKIVNWPVNIADALVTPCIAWKVPCEQVAPNACTSTVSAATYYGGFTYTKSTGTNR